MIHPTIMALTEPIRAQIDELVHKHQVVLFMKGTRHFPQCGFSASVVGVLAQYVPTFETVNVLASPEMREGIKEYSKWPTVPQLYIDGKFVGGSDIVREMHESGELATLLGKKPGQTESKAPSITIAPRAADAIKDASKEAGGDPLRVEIGPKFEVDLYFDTKSADDWVIEQSGVTVIVAKSVGARANGVSIDYVEGAGFRVDNPNAPPKVKSMSAKELKRALDAKENFLLLDVRSDAEIRTAKIPGSRPLDPDVVESTPKDAKLVIQCHHGVRSRAAAEQLLEMGFRNVFNLEGGIDAYSDVDPSVPRY